ncbi:DUF4834 family protein [Flavobacteriaceae bacterium AH-315-B10]|nr:DUF4834 family protein [Flavobacteriaceae bacterium AH-315-B10]
MGLLKTILIIVLVYYGFKILSRLFAPLLMRFVVKKAGQQFNQHQRQQQPKQKEGEVSVDKIPKQNKTSNKDVGEYVDYEEIE